MEKGYKQIVWLFVAITLLVFAGFFQSYFIKLGEPGQFKLVHHLHGFIMILWLALLICQPILIKAGKISLHRKLGKLSYGMMPVLIFLMLLAYKNQYLRAEAGDGPHSLNLAILLLPVTDTLPFLCLYLLAIYNRKKSPLHMRYIIANSLVLIGPPLGRLMFIFGATDFFIVSLVTYLATDALLVLFIIYDQMNGVKFKINPYFTSLILLLVCHTTLLYLPFSDLWQTVAEWVAKNVL